MFALMHKCMCPVVHLHMHLNNFLFCVHAHWKNFLLFSSFLFIWAVWRSREFCLLMEYILLWVRVQVSHAYERRAPSKHDKSPCGLIWGAYKQRYAWFATTKTNFFPPPSLISEKFVFKSHASIWDEVAKLSKHELRNYPVWRIVRKCVCNCWTN